jgi:hypothetical protein
MRAKAAKLTPRQGLWAARNAQSSPEETNSALRGVKRRSAISRVWWRGSSPTGS